MTMFPPGLKLVHGPHLTAELARWAGTRIPHVGPDGFGGCWAVGVVRAGGLAAVVVFSEFQREAGTVQLSCAADTPRWASRQVVAAILGAAFAGRLGGPVRKIWIMTPIENERAIRFSVGIGFRREAVLREQFAPKSHAVVCGMMRHEFRKRYGSKE